MCGVVHPFLRKIWYGFQSYTNSENVLVGPYSETYPTSHGADQAMSIKAEAVSDAEEEEDPLPKTIIEIKAEPEFYYLSILIAKKTKHFMPILW
jgi:hypothetical protein